MGGNIDVNQVAVKQFEDRVLTAVDGLHVQDKFLLALGSDTGDVLQVRVLSCGPRESGRLSVGFRGEIDSVDQSADCYFKAGCPAEVSCE